MQGQMHVQLTEFDPPVLVCWPIFPSSSCPFHGCPVAASLLWLARSVPVPCSFLIGFLGWIPFP
ncbi:hypothetical protein CNQ36_19350 [Streptomyces fungicidicus]|uniref:Uncharacterized protein n=1 Tax=Streptomyces fungicidicus TaxID=68203 RepID=A0A494UR88_9ACTN|nr:hypothetical protein CNQ36_19350 [Streptomyces fungicidicus]